MQPQMMNLQKGRYTMQISEYPFNPNYYFAISEAIGNTFIWLEQTKKKQCYAI